MRSCSSSKLAKRCPLSPVSMAADLRLSGKRGYDARLHLGAARCILMRMEYRLLGGSGLKVSALSFGTATFGGSNEFFKGFGETEVEEARRLIDICFEAGVNLFDTADGYSEGRSEEILGKALTGKRDKALISTKSGFATGPGPNDEGSSRYHLRRALEASLRRLGTDYIDIYHLHGFDALTPIEETQDTLNKFVREGKVRD